MSFNRQATCSTHFLQVAPLAGVCCENYNVLCTVTLQYQVVTQCKQEVSLLQVLIITYVSNLTKQNSFNRAFTKQLHALIDEDRRLKDGEGTGQPF